MKSLIFLLLKLINQLRNTNRGAAPANETQIQNLPSVTLDEVLIGIFLCFFKITFTIYVLNFVKKKKKAPNVLYAWTIL